MGLTAHSTWRFPLPGVNSGIQHVLNPDPFRGRWGGKNCRDSIAQTMRKCDCSLNECAATENYYQDLEEVFRYSIPVGRYHSNRLQLSESILKNVKIVGKCAGMFAESIQGVGGTVQFTKGYIKKAAALVRKNGGLFISDEVRAVKY